MTHYGFVTPNYGEYGDARTMADLASLGEDCGWDAFFLWDHLQISLTHPTPMVDPWVALTAMAMTTTRIRLGTWVTPVARRRPWKLARETVSLDRLSGGRLILGVGLGSPPDAEFAAFGEEPDMRIRAQKLDEGLAVLAGLWSGERFSFEGQHHHVEGAPFLPTPVQQPRIPVWVGGNWPNPGPFRRAARWDGVLPMLAGAPWDVVMSPAQLADVVAFVDAARSSSPLPAGEGGGEGRPYDVTLAGQTPSGGPAGAAVVAPYIEAGLTWWLEAGHHRRGTLADTRARIQAGPPG